MARRAYNRRTGKFRPVNMKRSRTAKRATRKLRGRHLTANHKRKIGRAVKRAWRTGKTKFGRRVRYKRTGRRRSARK